MKLNNLFKENEKLKEFVENNKKKILAFGLVLGAFIIYSFIPNSDEKNKDEKEMDFNIGKDKTYKEDSIGYNPDMNTNSNPKFGELTKADQKGDISNLDNSLNELENMSVDNSTPTITPYQPYGNRSMYTIPQSTPSPDYSYQSHDLPKTSTAKPKKESTADLYDFSEEKPISNNSGTSSANDLAERKRRFENGGNGSAQNSSKIKAVIRGTQELKNNQRIRLAVSEDVFMNNKRISKGTIIYGTIRFSSDRASLEVNSLKVNGDIMSVNLTGYSNDGLKGIPINSSQLIVDGKSALEDEAYNEVSSTGRIGNIVSSVLRKNKNNVSITFLDNTIIYLMTGL